jgi:hypothetical protein
MDEKYRISDISVQDSLKLPVERSSQQLLIVYMTHPATHLYLLKGNNIHTTTTTTTI